MSTKEEKLFFKKQTSVTDRSYNDKSSQFSNLNLNQGHKCPSSVQSFSSSKNATIVMLGGTVTNDYKDKRQIWNKSTKNDSSLKTSKSLKLSHESQKETENQKRWKNDKNPNKPNSSTLSLHIAAYENLIESLSKDDSKNLQTKSKKALKFVDPSLTKLHNDQDSFEFPRQMDGDESATTPQIQQFAASQKLFSPNQGDSSSNQMQPNAVTANMGESSENGTSQDALKSSFQSFLKHCTDDSLGRQKELVEELVKSIQSSEKLPEPLYKHVLGAIVDVSVNRFADREYFLNYEKLVNALSKVNPVLSMKYLSESVQTSIVPSVTLLNTRSTRGATFLARWLAQLIKDTMKKGENDQTLLTKAVSAFASAAFYGAYVSKRVVSLSHQANGIFIADNKLVSDGLKLILAENGGGLKAMILISLLLRKGSAALNSEHLNFLKSTWLECYSKAVLLSKPSLEKAYFTKINNTLSYFDTKEVEDMFVSNCKKALLREPEIAAPAISQFFEQYPNSTDSFALNFLQIANTSIVSTNDDVRQNIVDATGAVACRIADASILSKYIEQLFDLFKANSTKLPQRTSIAAAILYACKNVKTVENYESVIAKFAATLPSETNDAVLRLLWTAFGEWIIKVTEMPSSSLPILKKGLSSQGDTKSVSFRVAAIIYDKFGNVAVDPEILKVASAVCKAAKTEPIVSVDFIPAAALVLRSNALNGEKIDSDLFSTLSTKESINREKIYSSYANEEGLIIPIIAKRALISSLSPSSSYPSEILKLFCSSLVWPSYHVRTAATEVLKKLCVIEGVKLRSAIAECLLQATNDGSLDEVYNKASGIKQSAENFEPKIVPSGFFANILKNLLPEKKADWESETEIINFLVSSLFFSSASRVVEEHGAIWIFWIAKYPEIGDFVHSDAFCNAVFDRVFQCTDKILRRNVIRLLLSIHFKNSNGEDTGSFVSDKFWARFTHDLFALDKEEYLEVTKDQAGIFNTPETELYNVNVIEENSDLNLDAKNVKRENKAYSHKEQMAEIEIRKALAEKNRKEGKLTEKQKKAVAAEMKSEAEIRNRLKVLYDKAEILLMVLAEAARYNPQGACYNVTVLYEVVVPLLKSHLVSGLACETFLAFSDAFFEPSSDNLGALVGTAALRVLNALNYGDVHWEESLVDQLTRVFKSLASLCIYVDIPIDDEFNDEENMMDQISAWKLSFLIPVIEKILPSNYPIEFKLRVSQFLKSAINGHFLSASDIILPPLVRLHTFLVKQMCVDPYSDIFDDLKHTVSTYCTLLNQEVENPAAPVKEFFATVLGTFKNPIEMIRLMALKWLSSADSYLIKQNVEDSEFKHTFMVALYLETFDADTNCAEVATNLWGILRFSESSDLSKDIYDAVIHEHFFVQDEAAECINDLASQFPEYISTAITDLFGLYDKYLEIIPPLKDEVGRVIKEGRDPSHERLGIGKSLVRLADCLEAKHIQKFIELIADRLGERDPTCHTLLRNAGVIAIKKHGEKVMSTLLPYLDKKLSNTPEKKDNDNMRQGLVVLLGTLGMYLETQPDRVLQIFKKLITTLSIPSEAVQKSVADCLPQLVGFIENHSNDTLESLMHIMEASTNYGERRGAAYGIAAIIYGLRVYIVVEMQLLKRVEQMITSKSNIHQRESALLIMELLFKILGKSSEPFMPAFIPSLLTTFGDTSANVRNASNDAGKTMMAALSPHGAKLILPLILKATSNDNWRTKKASAELLGAVSQLAPRQLSSCLPKVVPTLVELLTDSHHEVVKAAVNALKEIAKVVKNPEIMSISTYLIGALIDPVSKTTKALETVLNTRFLHYMDPPSLALIMPIVKRAFSDRNTEAKRMSAQIIANIYTITEQKDMEPYLGTIVPGLQTALLDPVPEVRTTAARGFGALLKYSSESVRDQVAAILVPWLKERLVSQTSMVDRSGAAQGLSETIAAFGEEYLDASMPDILAITENPATNPYVRDGYLLLFIYLPIVLRERFVNFLSRTVAPLLLSLSDENEVVRSTALKAGQQLINLYVTQARTTLLPQLQKALFNENWRIRHASVQLIGDYLFNISGVSGKMSSVTADIDDTMGVETINKAILQNLGRQSRDEIFSGLYLCRQDVALVVRQAASHVWKVVVPNTPRVVRDIMSTLFTMLLKCLASSSQERQQTAARCLGEVVRKMGERLLSNILPILKDNLETDHVEQRVGVAEALNEVLNNCSRESIATLAGEIMIILNKCLSDSSPAVRSSAAPPFNLLMQIIGVEALDQIVHPMVNKFLETSDPDTLDALCTIVHENSRSFLPPILPKLTKQPVNAYGLCRIAASSGTETLNRYLPQFLRPLLSSRVKKEDFEEFLSNCQICLTAITDEQTMLSAVSQLVAETENQNIIGIALLRKWVENSEWLFDEEIVDEILPAAIGFYANNSSEIVDQAIATVESIVGQTEQGHAIEYLPLIKKALEDMASKVGENNVVPGFNKPEGFAAFLPVIKDALFNGTNAQKEQAIAVCELFTRMASSSGISKHATFIAGPLIRSVGDRFLTEARKSALTTFKTLFEKVPTFVKIFVPQIQTELIKLLQVENLGSMKQLFAATLSHALCNHVKSEIVFNDLLQFLLVAEDAKVLETGFLAVSAVIVIKKKDYSTETLQKAAELASTYLKSSNSTLAGCAKELKAAINDEN